MRDIGIAERISDQPIFHGLLAKDAPGSIQQTFGPLYYYLIWISLHIPATVYYYPLLPTFLVITLNLLSVVLCFIFCKNTFGNRVALIATSLYASSAWIILHASVFTNPNFLPPFILLAFIAYYKILIEDKKTYFYLFFPSIAAQLHFHLSALLLLPVFASIFLLKPALFKNKHVYFSGLLAIILFIPFFITLANTQDLSVFGFVGDRYESTYLTNIVDGIGIPFMYTTPYLGPYLLGQYQLFPALFFDVLYYTIIIIFCLIFGLGVLSLIKHLASSRFSNPQLLPLLIWLFIPTFLAIISKANISPHYLIILLPVQFVIMALFLDKLITKIPWITYFIVFLVLFNFLFVTYFYMQMNNQGTSGLFGIPYKHKVELVEQMIDISGDNVVVNYYPSASGSVYNYLLSIRNKTPDAHILPSVFNYTEGLLLVDSYSFYAHFQQGPTLEEQAFLNTLPSTPIRTFILYTSPP